MADLLLLLSVEVRQTAANTIHNQVGGSLGADARYLPFGGATHARHDALSMTVSPYQFISLVKKAVCTTTS
jgi:hypothetical protein